MHELGLTQQIIEIACARAGGAPIQSITVEIGKLAAVLPDAVRFAYDLCKEGTAAAGATLTIIETPGRARCRVCGLDVLLDRPYGQCGAGHSDLEWLSGEELRIRAMEILDV